jgi:transposase
MERASQGASANRGAWADIPLKSNRSDPVCFSRYLYRARNQVERFFNRIKQCRRVATRYDSLAGNYLRPTRIYPAMAGRAL